MKGSQDLSKTRSVEGNRALWGPHRQQTADGKLQTADLICKAEDSKAEDSRTANLLEAEDCRTIKMQRH